VTTNDTVARSDDRIPDYSSSGPTWYDALVKPDLLAPGHRVIAVGAKQSLIYNQYPELRAPDSDYIRLSGTSMATAVGSGVVALMIDIHRDAAPHSPALTPNMVKAMLQYSAFAVRNDLGFEYDPLREGAGALNGAGALTLAASVDTSAPAGTFWLQPQPLPSTVNRGHLGLGYGLGQRQRGHLGQQHRLDGSAGVGQRRHLGQRRPGHDRRHRGDLGQQRRHDGAEHHVEGPRALRRGRDHRPVTEYQAAPWT